MISYEIETRLKQLYECYKVYLERDYPRIFVNLLPSNFPEPFDTLCCGNAVRFYYAKDGNYVNIKVFFSGEFSMESYTRENTLHASGNFSSRLPQIIIDEVMKLGIKT